MDAWTQTNITHHRNPAGKPALNSANGYYHRGTTCEVVGNNRGAAWMHQCLQVCKSWQFKYVSIALGPCLMGKHIGSYVMEPII